MSVGLACGAGPAARHRAGDARGPGAAAGGGGPAAHADLLNEGEKIAILAWAGARHAREELLTPADTIGAPIVKTLSGKATVLAMERL